MSDIYGSRIKLKLYNKLVVAWKFLSIKFKFPIGLVIITFWKWQDYLNLETFFNYFVCFKKIIFKGRKTDRWKGSSYVLVIPQILTTSARAASCQSHEPGTLSRSPRRAAGTKHSPVICCLPAWVLAQNWTRKRTKTQTQALWYRMQASATPLTSSFHLLRSIWSIPSFRKTFFSLNWVSSLQSLNDVQIL